MIERCDATGQSIRAAELRFTQAEALAGLGRWAEARAVATGLSPGPGDRRRDALASHSPETAPDPTATMALAATEG